MNTPTKQSRRLATVALASALLGGAADAANATTTCRALEYSFTSDCMRAPGDTACTWHAEKPDLGPQIAVWVESADRARFVDTLMVTNATALYGIGNRPGLPSLRSGPKFPYGRRPMALPVWAHARGKTYPLVVMQDGQEGLLTYHEGDSSPEPHFCCPMLPDQEVDAITCPSAAFRSDKGRLDATQTSVYPPRGDLFDLGTICPVLVNHPGGSCNAGDSRQYAFLDDVDTVSTATPPFGIATQGAWTVPADLPVGDYALLVEVGKEFDTNDAYDAANAPSLDYDAFGTAGNLGQPSVIYRVPFSVLPSDITGGGAASAMFGYGDVTGATGVIAPPDATISVAPGSGEGRLATTTGPDGAGRVHVSFASCAPVDCATEGAPPAVPISVVMSALMPTEASVQIEQVGNGTKGEDYGPVTSYEIRVAPLPRDGEVDITPEDFVSWAAESSPAPAAPGTLSAVALAGLTPATAYGVGVVAHGSCGSSPVTFARFTTPALPAQDSHLRGCFIATAAFGS
ncbi:MAG TPA: hypothetical protein VLA14_12810, partial [Polyangia bacterium]|nr:hypothetical protein [Polyangia bacterium]